MTDTGGEEHVLDHVMLLHASVARATLRPPARSFSSLTTEEFPAEEEEEEEEEDVER